MADKKNDVKKKIKKKIEQQVQTTIFGNLPDPIETDPQYTRRFDQQLQEAAAGRLAVFTFGRFNPPTVGHEKLVDRVKKTAMERGGTPFVFLSHTNDKNKNPLSYKQKTWLAKRAFGNVVRVSNSKTIYDIARELNKNFDRIVMVVGSDRVTEFQRMLTTANGKDFQFADIHVISAGERDPDSLGVAGMSAELMRNYAASGNLSMFAKGLPTRLQPHHKKVFDMVRGAQLNEEVSMRQLNDIERFADKLLARYDIDIEFTRHFLERVNDSRNDPEITIAELQRFFKKIAREKGNKIHNHEDLEVVLKDISAQLNLPAVIERRSDGDFEVTMKTIMRKRNFRSTSPSVVYEAIMTRTHGPGGMIEPVGGRNTKNAANNQNRRAAGDRLKGTPDRAPDVKKTAEGRAMGRVYQDMGMRTGMEAMNNPDPAVRQAEMQKMGPEMDKYRKYYDQELRGQKTKGTSRRTAIKEGISSAERALKARTSYDKGTGAGKTLEKQEIRDLRNKADKLMYTGKDADQKKALKIKSQIKQYGRQQMFKEDEQLDEVDFPSKDQLSFGSKWALAKKALGNKARKTVKDVVSSNAKKKISKGAATAAVAGLGYGVYRGAKALAQTRPAQTARREYQDFYDTLKNS